MIMAPQINISEWYLKRLATVYDNQDVASQTIREMASELLSLRQQISQIQAPAVEPAQAVPYAWHVPPMVRMYFGKFAQIDAESEARHVGGTAKAIALYTAPPAIDEEIRKSILELCRLTLMNGAVDGCVTAAMEEMAGQIREKLEAGNGE